MRWLSLILCCIGFTAGAADRTRLTVYTTLEPYQIAAYKQAFEADHPDIEIAWVRDSTGIIAARLLAEKERPRGGVVWGLAVTSIITLQREGMLVPYAPANLKEIRPSFRDPAEPPAWVGIDGWVAAVCLNGPESRKANLPTPKSWAALLDPVYRGKLVMPNPTSSGTGYFHVAMWLQSMGEEAGWRYMDGLHENIALYVHSGSKPCKMAAAGEYPIGISAEVSGAQAKQAGAPIEVLLMAEGGGWDMDTTAILKGTETLEAAKRLADWSASRKANELYGKYLAITAIPGTAQPMPGYPAGVEASMFKTDFAWAADNRARVLAEWQRRYAGKSEPK